MNTSKKPMSKMSKKKKPKAIRIATLHDLLNAATPENFNSLMQDTALWLSSMMVIRSVGAEIADVAMDWTDDGNNEITGYDIKVRKPGYE
jgi:hypothetical protein